jgi:hypothetical protein
VLRTLRGGAVIGKSRDYGRSAAASGLQKAGQVVALDAQADYAGRVVDLVDRCGRDDPAAASEKPGADGECVGDVRSRPVHRTLDSADNPAVAVGDEKAGQPPEVTCSDGHDANLSLRSKEKL